MAAAGTVANVSCLLRHRNCNDVIILVQRSFTSTCADVLLLNAVDIALHRRSTVDVAAVLQLLLVLVSAVVLAVAAVDAARVVHVVAA